MKKKQINIKDVAKLASVSTATVSRFLHGEMNRMSKDTAVQVKKAIEKLNYVPNAAARQLITSKSKTIAIIVVNISDAFSTELFRGACSTLEPAGYVTVMLNTDSNQRRENQLINAVGLNTYDGLILQPLGSNVTTIQREIRREMPIVTLDRSLVKSPWPQILSNNYEASFEAGQYFKKAGYENVIVLSSPISIASTRKERLRGVKDVFPNVSIIEIDEEQYDRHNILSRIHQLLAQTTQKTLLFSLKERWLLEFLPSLAKEMDELTSKIQISGFADTNLVSAIWPEAKMIIQDPFEMGKQAGSRLLELLGEKEDTKLVTKVATKF